MRHKHADLIKAWAEGAIIECWQVDDIWKVVENPNWSKTCEYRVKPEPKPDVVVCYGASAYQTGLIVDTRVNPKLKLTFDGETGELKSAEVLK